MQLLALTLAMLTAAPEAGASTNPAQILLVRATASVANPAERKYAQAVAGNISRRLTETGIPHDMTDDDKVDGSTLAGRRVVVLPYNPNPPQKETAALARHAASGGKLVVFFSGSEGIAKAMGVKFTAAVVSQQRDRWCAFRFNQAAPPNAPPVVRQYSRSMRAVEPATTGAKVIASWEDVAGKPTQDPAWVRTPSGYWMTHIILDDGDNDAKNRMLLAILGDLAPSIWPAAARHRLAEAGAIGSHQDIAAAMAAARAVAADAATKARVEGRIAAANLRYSRLVTLLERGEYAAVSDGCPDLRQAVLSAYSAAFKPAADRRRGVWDRHGLGLYPGDWDRTCTTLSNDGINALFVNMLTAGSAHYASKVLAPSDTAKTYGDQLKAASDAASRHGIEFHVWAICWSLQGAPQDTVQAFAKQGRLQKSDKAEVPNWLCPTHPDNVTLQKDAIRELVRLAPFNGIHLDYIRFHDSRACVCDGCRDRFEKQLGRPVKKWPADVLGKPLRDEFNAWRMDRISRVVEDVSAILRSAQSNAVLSAAVYGHYPSATASVAQDWRKWVEKGWLDFICPMDYTADLARFGEYVKDQVRLVGAQRVFPGIGVTAAESRLDASQVLDQIATSRRLGAQGFVFFDLNRILTDDVLPYLRLTEPLSTGKPIW